MVTWTWFQGMTEGVAAGLLDADKSGYPPDPVFCNRVIINKLSPQFSCSTLLLYPLLPRHIHTHPATIHPIIRSFLCAMHVSTLSELYVYRYIDIVPVIGKLSMSPVPFLQQLVLCLRIPHFDTSCMSSLGVLTISSHRICVHAHR